MHAQRPSRWVLVITSMLLAGGCARPAPQLAAPKPAEVIVSRTATRTITDFEEFTGRIKAIKSADIRARVTGYLDKVLFKDGAEVQKGEVLFEIDPRTYDADLARGEAALNQAKSRQKRLANDHQRALVLRRRGGSSPEEFDKVAGDLDEAAAAVKSAEASRDMAKLNVTFTKVLAPYGGVVSDRRIDPGNLVKADETILTKVVALDPIYAYFDLDERTLLRLLRMIAEGKMKSSRDAKIRVDLGLSDEDDFPHSGTIDFADIEVEPGTGTKRVRAVFDNPAIPSNSRRLLSPGLFVRVRLPIGDPHQSLIVPERSLGSDQGQKFVFVVTDDNVAVTRWVKVGALNKGYRVIDAWDPVRKTGLSPGDKVIVDGLQRVRHGTKVEAKVEDIPALAGASPSQQPPARVVSAQVDKSR